MKGARVNWDRAIVIVLDGVGIGEAPDAALYGDQGSHSLANTARAVGGLRLPALERLGLGRISPIEGVAAVQDPEGCYGKLRPRSPGKDSITGHWELMGVRLKKAFPTYPNGFPEDLIAQISEKAGREIIGNCPASGTEIIERLGPEHLRTGALIGYTSADSVFQVAAHESVVSRSELYRICEEARKLLTGENCVARVIARPFEGEPGSFRRTEGRRDFPLLPEEDTLLDRMSRGGWEVVTVGKIDEMFGGRGITRKRHVVANRDSIQGLLENVAERFRGLLFVNLVETDMVYGHRNDPAGYAGALREFDAGVPELRSRLRPGDLAFIVSDHGVDPTTPGTDHSREYAPLLVFGPAIRRGRDLGERAAFSDVAATIAQMFGVEGPRYGESFLPQLMDGRI